MELTEYAKLLTNAVLENDDNSMNNPWVRRRRPVVRVSGWLKGSDRTMFTSIFVYEEMYALRVNIRSNGNGCFHYPAIPKTEITPQTTSELAERIIADVKEHIESKM